MEIIKIFHASKSTNNWIVKEQNKFVKIPAISRWNAWKIAKRRAKKKNGIAILHRKEGAIYLTKVFSNE
jgi:hypothetical protein